MTEDRVQTQSCDILTFFNTKANYKNVYVCTHMSAEPVIRKPIYRGYQISECCTHIMSFQTIISFGSRLQM